VVDESGHEVPHGVIGRLRIRAPSAALMYWQDAERSKRTFDGELVMSGDLVERDGSGYYWYRGREDALLKVGGIWVAPDEVERCLLTHVAVAGCAVVGVERGGLTRAHAFVVPAGGAHVTPESLRAHVRARLAPHKVPQEVHLLAELPRTGSGKIDRPALRELATGVAAAS